MSSSKVDLDTPPKINRTHISLYVKDPEVSSAWYQDVLGMQETARGENLKWIFMSFGVKHHDIALIKVASEEQLAHGTLDLQHYGLEIEGDLKELQRLYSRLLIKKVPIVKITDHKVGIGLYFTDPDGHRLELFCETIHENEEGKRILGLFNAPSEPYPLEPLVPIKQN